jgi:hypothetical protein
MSEAACAVCRQQPARVGVLCPECASELRGGPAITPEQLVLRGVLRAGAGLVDVWGRVYRLGQVATIGRDFETDGLVILDSSISRAHARITCIEGRWYLRDLDSMNGTFVDDSRITGEAVLQDGERVRFAEIAMFFLAHPPEAPAFDAEALVGYTLRSPATTTGKLDRDLVPLLPPVKLRLDEPSGGGGGLLALDDKQVQLTVPQFELLSLLIARMTAERERPEPERGFVSAKELAERLSLDSALPNEDHVRQLVRRLRRALAKAGVGNLVETRYGVGYRLRGTPS